MMMRASLAIVALAASLLLPGRAAFADNVVPVPSVTIYPGDAIGDQQITEQTVTDQEMGRVPVIEDRALLIGKIAKRTLLPGRPIPKNGIKDADVITRGGTVMAVYTVGGLTITSMVSPLRAGGIGDVIEARNIDSGLIIKGEVQPDGTLRVGPRK